MWSSWLERVPFVDTQALLGSYTYITTITCALPGFSFIEELFNVIHCASTDDKYPLTQCDQRWMPMS